MIEEKDIFRTMIQLADGITTMFGRNFEVAIHDLRNIDRSLIYLSGSVTGRKAGAPATDLLVKAISQKADSLQDMHNYKTTTKDGRSIKSSTMFIRDGESKVIGAFCINIDTTDFFNAAQTLAPFLNVVCSHETDIQENFSASADETIESIFEHALLEMGKQPASMTTQERISLVAHLEVQGVFQMKGAVNRIAKLCGVSKFSIYNYLKSIRNSEKNTYSEASNEAGYPN